MATVIFIKQDSVRQLVADLTAIGDKLEAEEHPLWFHVARAAATLESLRRGVVVAGDVARPLKNLLPDYRVIEARVQADTEEEEMPDLERTLRSLELHVAATPEEKAYVAGLHAGLDKARWQIVRLCAGFALGVVIYQVW